MNTVYLIMSHSDQDSDFDIVFASTDEQEFKGCCKDFDFELDEDKFKKDKCQDFGWYDYTRYVAYAFDVENPTEHLYALCSNGYERFGWEGVVFGLFKSKEEVRDVLIKKLAKWGDEEDLEEELGYFDKYDTLSDPDMIDWSCVRVNLVNIQK